MIFQQAKTGILEIDFINYLYFNMSNKNTILFQNDSILAKRFNVTRKTIENVKKKLRKADIIKYTRQIIFVNPEKAFRGNAKKRNERISEYWSFKEIAANEEEK